MSTYLQLQFVVSTFMSVYTAQQCSVTDYCEIQELYITFFKHNQKVHGTNITTKLCSLSWTDIYLHSCPKCRQNSKHGNINTTTTIENNTVLCMQGRHVTTLVIGCLRGVLLPSPRFLADASSSHLAGV